MQTNGTNSYYHRGQPSLFHTESHSSLASTPASSSSVDRVAQFASKTRSIVANDEDIPAHLTTRKFKILTKQEIRDLRQKRKVLKRQLEKKFEHKTNAAYMDTKLKEMESCFQYVKDKLQAEKKEKQEARDEVQQKEACIAQLEGELRRAGSQKRLRDEQHDKLERQHKEKVRRIEHAEKEIQFLRTQLEGQKQLHEQTLNTLTETEIELDQTKQLSANTEENLKQNIASLREDLKKETESHTAIQLQLIETTRFLKTKEEELVHTKNIHALQLQKEQKTAQTLQDEIEELKKSTENLEGTLREKDTQIGRLNDQLSHQSTCLHQIETALSLINKYVSDS